MRLKSWKREEKVGDQTRDRDRMFWAQGRLTTKISNADSFDSDTHSHEEQNRRDVCPGRPP